MTKHLRSPLAIFVAALSLVGLGRIAVKAQSAAVGQNINIITGSSDQFIGDMFRQRQNEPVLGTSSVNPAHMIAAYNDYRTVDFADDPGVGTSSPGQSLIARIFDVLRAPWKLARGEREREREGEEEGDAAQAWIGISISDNGKNWYTGLMPGHVSVPMPPEAQPWDQSEQVKAYEAASDPVMASTPSQFFIGGIAFTPNGGSVGFVSRFTDHNDTQTDRNIRFDGLRILLSQPATFFVDKPSIAAGPNGHVYAAFVVFDQTDPTKLSSKIMFFRSSDSGLTWSSGQVISNPLTRNQSPWIVVDPNNENTVYIGWRLFAYPALPNLSNAIVGRKSTDGGVTFTPSIPYPVALLLKAYDAPQTPLSSSSLPIPRSNAYPTAAMDGNGAIHVAMQEYVYPSTYPIAALRGLPLAPGASPSTGVPRVTVTSSFDGGVTWTLRAAVDFGAGSGSQFMPVLTAIGEPGPSCAGKTGPSSRVILMYYDARASGVGTVPGGNGFVAGGDKQFDVRITQASACNRDGLGRLVFSPSEQVSRYTLNPTGSHTIVTRAGSGVTSVNRAYTMFCGGNCGFTGDYIGLTPRVPYVQTSTGWALTTARAVDKTKLPAPIAQGVWADMRDAVLPTTGPIRVVPNGGTGIDALPWNVYQPPGTGLVSCLNPGSRDQNVYTAEYAPGQLFAGAPETFQTSNIARAYPVFVENRAGTERFFRLTIDPAANASFDYHSFDTTNATPVDRSADIVLGPYSSVTGSVVIGPGVSTPVPINVAQLGSTTDGQGNTISTGTLLAGGVQTNVTLLPAPSAAGTTTETHPPVISQTPAVTKPFQGSTFPIIATTPFTQTPFTQTTFAQNPFTQTPFTQTTAIYDVTDYSFQLTNGGSDVAAYQALLQIQNALRLQGSYLFQVMINRLSSTTALNGCQAFDQTIELQISNILAPFTQTPFTQTPFTQTPFTQTPFTQTPFTQTPFTQTPFTQTSDPRDPTISNSTFYAAPGNGSSPTFVAGRPVDVIEYTLRAYQIKANNDPTFVPIAPPNQPPQIGVTVTAQTPNIVVVNGQSVFDPAGPPTASGGTAVPVKLAFVQGPTSAAPATAISPAVTVAVEDGFGVLVPGATGSVTIALGANPSAGTLSGTLTAAIVGGIATFANLSINQIGSGYTLVATSGALQPATSSAFDIFPPITVTTLAVPEATVGELYSQAVFATGGVKPYVWDIKPIPGSPEFSLPDGLALTTQQDSSGLIAGTPTTEQVHSFRLRVTDAQGHSATQDLCIHVNPSTSGTLTVTPKTADTTAASIAQTLVGEGVTISNVTYAGVDPAIGTFAGGFGATGLSSGIVLSSGGAKQLEGPNNSESESVDNQTDGDVDLSAIVAPQSTLDAAVLEFDFVVTNPNASVVKFDYVFASEEYNEFANSQYNDVFAFFVNGPDVPRANYAIIPGTSTPVSINTVNGGNPFGTNAQHPELFVNNSLNFPPQIPPLNTQADGLTKVVSLQVPIVPGQTYHLKIAIADTTDRVYDSWVLLKESSLSAVCPIIPSCPTCGQ